MIMKKVWLQIAGISALTTVLSGCFLQLVGAPGGTFASTTIPSCAEGATCTNAEMKDTSFNETFLAFPSPGFKFLHWKSGSAYLFGCNTSLVNLSTGTWGGTFLEAFFTKPDQFYISPVFRSTGAQILYTTDFECNNASATTLGDGWNAYVNVFQADGSTYVGGYSIAGGAPNGAQISALTTGQGGAAQSSRQLNVFSNYDSDFNGDGLEHAVGQQVQVLVFQEYTLLPGSAGTYTFTFDAKKPLTAGVAAPSTAIAFVKVLDPANNYQPMGPVVSFDSTTLTPVWSTHTLTFTITSAMANKRLQFGFQNTATDYNPSGVIYDNLVFREIPST
jgi:hypothetical protein